MQTEIISFRIPKSLKKDLKALAYKESSPDKHVTVTDMAIKAMDIGLKSLQNNEAA